MNDPIFVIKRVNGGGYLRKHFNTGFLLIARNWIDCEPKKVLERCATYTDFKEASATAQAFFRAGEVEIIDISLAV